MISGVIAESSQKPAWLSGAATEWGYACSFAMSDSGDSDGIFILTSPWLPGNALFGLQRVATFASLLQICARDSGASSLGTVVAAAGVNRFAMTKRGSSLVYSFNGSLVTLGGTPDSIPDSSALYTSITGNVLNSTAEMAIWGRALSDRELVGLSTNFRPYHYGNGLRQYIPAIVNFNDACGNTGTISVTSGSITVERHPGVF